MLGLEYRRHQTWPVRTQLGGDQVDELGVVGHRQGADLIVQPQLTQHQAGRRSEHAVTAGDLVGEFAQRGCVDRRSAATPRRRQCHRNALACGHRSDRRVDGLVDGAGVGQRTLVQVPHGTAADAGALAGSQHDLDCDVLGPALAEFPGLRDPLGDGGRPLAGRAENRAQLVVDGVGKHWAVRLIGAGQLGHLRPQTGQVGLGGTVDGTQVQLRAQVHQQLVAPRRRAVGDGLDGVQLLDLVDAHFRRQRDQCQGGVGRAEPDVIGTRSTRRSCGGSRSDGWGDVRAGRTVRRRRNGCGGILFGLRLGVGVIGEQHRGVALGIEHFDSAVGIFGQVEGIGGQSGDGRRRLHADLDEPLRAQAAGRLLGEQQILSLDPAHRAGELPGQQLDQHCARQVAWPLATPRVVVGEDLVERLGGDQIADLLDEVTVQRERARHQVRDVASDDHLGIFIARHDPLQRAPEIGDADPQHPRMERHVDARHQNE